MLKTVLKRALRIIGKNLPSRRSRRVIVLCYHSIHPSKPFLSATPELFSQHLEWLREHCEVVPFSEIPSAGGAGHSRPAVAITFDDGHEDNHRFALPILKEHGLSATFFLTAGLLEKDPEVVHRFEQLRHAEYEDIRPLEWSQVREMLSDGMNVGAHSYSHRNLARLGSSELRHEMLDAKGILEERLQLEIETLAYPFGKPRIHFTESAVAMAKKTGYKLAAAIVTRGVRETDSPFRIPRIYGYGSLDLLREKVAGDWDLVGLVQERSPLWLTRMISPIDFAY
jgi:peptidoglycan/xylan/chitin deacetylase (PgdA/CDA1 family)